MKISLLIGSLLIVIGIVALVQRGIHYKTEEKILDIGPIEATATKNKTIPLSPILGIVSLAGGLALVIVAVKGKKS